MQGLSLSCKKELRDYGATLPQSLGFRYPLLASRSVRTGWSEAVISSLSTVKCSQAAKSKMQLRLPQRRSLFLHWTTHCAQTLENASISRNFKHCYEAGRQKRMITLQGSCPTDLLRCASGICSDKR